MASKEYYFSIVQLVQQNLMFIFRQNQHTSYKNKYLHQGQYVVETLTHVGESKYIPLSALTPTKYKIPWKTAICMWKSECHILM